MALLVTAIVGFFASVGSTVIGAAVLRIGASLLISAAVQALAPKPRRDEISQGQVEQKLQLSRESELPQYRFVYGHDRAVGTPAPVRVRGDFMYVCYLFNSRPSDMGSSYLWFDDRPCAIDGNPFDFAGPGAGIAGAVAGFARIWIGRGDQTSPPAQILSECPWVAGTGEDGFLPTDGWRGRTVMWLRYDIGPPGSRADRWLNVPPILHCTADWSKVWDPRNPAQNPDDPATWAYSDNLALCILDAARTNPVKAYPLSALILPQFIAAANNADEILPLLSGSTERRYRARGTLVWGDGEIEDQLLPLFDAGAARPIKQSGMLGIAPGAWVTPSFTLTDFVGGELEIVGTQTGDLATQIRTSYISEERLYESAELPPYDIPGAQAADGGIPRIVAINCQFAASATQAQRAQKIRGRLLRRQKELRFVAWPEAVNLVAGSTLNLDLPAPYNRFNNTYEVQRIHPAFSPVGDDGGMALICPMTIVEHRADIYEWVPATDEIVIAQQPFVVPPAASGSAVIDVVNVATGAGVDIDANRRIRFDFAPISGYASNYEWQISLNSGIWQSGSLVDAAVRDTLGNVFGFTETLLPATDYRIRVRVISTRYVNGASVATQSGWTESDLISTI